VQDSERRGKGNSKIITGRDGRKKKKNPTRGEEKKGSKVTRLVLEMKGAESMGRKKSP